MSVQPNSTIQAYFEIIYDYHHKVMSNESPRIKDFFIERMHLYLESIKRMYDIIEYSRNQADKNYLSVAEFMCKQASNK